MAHGKTVRERRLGPHKGGPTRSDPAPGPAPSSATFKTANWSKPPGKAQDGRTKGWEKPSKHPFEQGI